MKSLTKKVASRLEIQSKEANLQGRTKLAKHLTEIVKTSSVRDTEAKYTYRQEDLQEDIENNLWLSVARVLDYFDTSIDAAQIEGTIEKIASGLIDEIRVAANIDHGIGPFEPAVPGEHFEHVVLEVEDENS